MNKELEIYYEMEQCCSREWGDLDDLQLVEKSLKALEIIKEKMVDTRALIEIFEDEWTWEQYMDEEDDINTGGHQFSRDRLTQEEYDLLKEVLDND